MTSRYSSASELLNWSPRMNDTDIIQQSYEELIQELFQAYWNDAFVGHPTVDQIKHAEAKFREGTGNARKARDRAIILLQS
jgi:hypothetical protein